eukprot:CCRYP_002483-RB/>CCRYP_002483-RB protein AED:0.35 eAED:0.37 QI:166/0.71/0.5/1/0.42/0.5/8/0/425
MNIKNLANILASLTNQEEKAQRVIGGRESAGGRYSYAVSLADNIGAFCGASLIAPDVVLSAAHCSGGSYRAIIGRHDLDTNEGDEVEIKKEIVHPQYDASITDNDFMLLILERPTTAKVAMVQLNDDPLVPEVGSEVIVMGWGDTTADDLTMETSSVLMEVSVNVISNTQCQAAKGKHNGYSDSYDGWITEHMLCAVDENEDSCQGDSGGPLVVRNGNNKATGENDVQVGVVSWGIGCATNTYPGVYAPIRDDTNGTSHNIAIDWVPLLTEDFKTGYGFFNEIPNATSHYKFLKNRVGVVRLRNMGEGVSFNSRKILLNNTGYDWFSITLDMYAIDMTEEELFCLDYSRNSGVTWMEVVCIDNNQDFETNVWYSPDIEFPAGDGEDTLMIRFRNTGDVLLNKVEIYGLDLFDAESIFRRLSRTLG